MRSATTASLIAAALTFVGCVHGRGIASMYSPKLRRFLHEHPKASEVLIQAVANSVSNAPVEIYYFYTEDESIPSASHHYREDGGIGFIIRENQLPTDEFISLLYEVINSENKEQFQRLIDKARSGDISRKEFAEGMLKTELQAVNRTRGLLSHLDLTSQETSQSVEYKRFLNCPEDFIGFLAYTKKVASPHTDAIAYYESKYDHLRNQH